MLAHASALSSAMDGQLILIRVLAPHFDNDLPPDPVEWEAQRREAGSALARMVERAGVDAQIVLTEGRPVAEICHEAERRGAEFIVIGRFGEGVEDGDCAVGMGATTRAVLERARGKVLLVPEDDQCAPNYRRILVPLDGSCWAESAQPTATRIARSTGAGVVLVQVVTPPEFVCPTPPEPGDAELRERIIDRNNRAARGYLERQRGVLAEQGVVVRTQVIGGTDPRHRLLELTREETFDLVVLSARGSGFRHLPGLHFGSVAAHLSLHSATPLLIVRSDTDVSQRTGARQAVATAPARAALHA
ncbi:MAG: universal stress protein [Pararhodobacter sp.]|nr:universal stress protein [Pararhodobacter sp.]